MALPCMFQNSCNLVDHFWLCSASQFSQLVSARYLLTATQMDGGWTTVGKKDTGRAKKKGDPKKADAPVLAEAASQSAFASLDKNWKRQQGAATCFDCLGWITACR